METCSVTVPQPTVPNPDTPKPPPIGKMISDNFLLNWHQAYLVVHDLPVGLDEALRIEGGLAVEHLVHAHSQRPPVALRTVAALTCKMAIVEFWVKL